MFQISVKGKKYHIVCSKTTESDSKHHKYQSIDADIDESILLRMFSGETLAEDGSFDTEPCSRLVPSGTGLKLQHCRMFWLSFHC
jgi:hypothetical protein